MMPHSALKNVFEDFAQTAAPYLHIVDKEHYEEALSLIEQLMEEAKDSHEDPINGVINMLGNAIAHYEEQVKELSTFDTEVRTGPADVAMLRVLMDQHNLGMVDFPEIGDKSLISRILSGSRNLTKQHIEKLSERFNISPGLFFDLIQP